MIRSAGKMLVRIRLDKSLETRRERKKEREKDG